MAHLDQVKPVGVCGVGLSILGHRLILKALAIILSVGYLATEDIILSRDEMLQAEGYIDNINCHAM